MNNNIILLNLKLSKYLEMYLNLESQGYWQLKNLLLSPLHLAFHFLLTQFLLLSSILKFTLLEYV